LPDGGLASEARLVEILGEQLEEFGPELIYGPSPQELHSDHRAASHALLRAVAQGPQRRILLYGVNTQVTASVLIDVTSVWETKKEALRRFASQIVYHDLVQKTEFVDRSRTINMEDRSVVAAEGFASIESSAAADYERAVAALLDVVVGPGHGLEPQAAGPAPQVPPQHTVPARAAARERGLPGTTAVISTWNKAEDVIANLEAIEAQTLPFEEIVVVDNASRDDTVRRITARFPRVRLIVMPHDRYGACETFNIGFASVRTPLTAILDDDVILPPEWLEATTLRLLAEPLSTAIVSTKVVEPGMPDSYRFAPEVNAERYMSTFRGCSSLARSDALAQAGYYDERLFIYGNERDLTCRLLNLGYRVLSFPAVETFHRTPFGIKMGKRSLYFHARNAFLAMIKYAPLKDLVALPFLAFSKVILRSRATEERGTVAVAVGTIGIGKSLRETKGAWWVLVKAGASVLWNVPYCLRRRQPVSSSDFELPLH